MDTEADFAVEQIDDLANAIIDDADNFDVAVNELIKEGWSEKEARKKVAGVYCPSDIKERQAGMNFKREKGSLF